MLYVSTAGPVTSVTDVVCSAVSARCQASKY